MTADTTLERRPGGRNPNANIALVHPFVVRGELNHVITAATGIQGNELIEAVRANYRHGFVPRPNPEEKRRTHKLNTSAAKGGILLAIEEYIPLDLTAKQTQTVLEADHGTVIKHYRRITQAYFREVYRNGLARPVRELMVEAQRDKHRSPEQLLSIVKNRQIAFRYVSVFGLEKPNTLVQWHELEGELNNSLMRIPTREELIRLAEMLLNPIFVPRDPIAQRYLLNIAEGVTGLNARLEELVPNLGIKQTLKADLVRRQAKAKMNPRILDPLPEVLDYIHNQAVHI